VPIDYDKLSKILSLAGSDSDGEALAALRRAQAQLAAHGMSFTDLAERLRRGGGEPSSVWHKAAEQLGAYLRERTARQAEMTALNERIAALESAGRAKDRTIASLRNELAALAAAVERAMPTDAQTGGESPARPRRRGPQFELALE
jgi:DNA repair ATPase RecN